MAYASDISILVRVRYLTMLTALKECIKEYPIKKTDSEKVSSKSQS